MAKRIKKLASKAKKAIARLTAWSFSRWQDYETCPAKAKYKHVEKRREPDNAAMQNGTIVHKLAEQFTRGQLVKLPVELKNFKLEFAALKKSKAIVEQEWAFDENWEKVDWFASNAWARIKVDAHHVLSVPTGKKKPNTTTIVIVDHKTGRSKPEHQQQRDLYALGAFSVYPDAALVEVSHWYIDSGESGLSVYKVKDLPLLKKQWEQRTRAMLNDTMFAPRPGSYCRWCHFRKENGGPCQF